MKHYVEPEITICLVAEDVLTESKEAENFPIQWIDDNFYGGQWS